MTQFTLSANTQELILTALSSTGQNNINNFNAYNAIHNELVTQGSPLSFCGL
jgi:hypothetical protein